MKRALPWAALALVALLILVTRAEAVVRGVQVGFLLAGAPAIGAVLLLAIARLTGADWSPLLRFPPMLALVLPLGLLAMLANTAPLPDHLRLWQHPIATALRAGAGLAALWWVGGRIGRGAPEAMAGLLLASYALLVTPIGADWLLPGEPGHPVSAIGMMLFVQQIIGATALLLLLPLGGERLRSDMAKLLVAAALGLCYLSFMDYLIVWFGNLPARVPFYLARNTPGSAVLVITALLLDLAVPITALSLAPAELGRRLAGGGALAGLWLFDLWWLDAGILAALIGAVVAVLPLVALRGERTVTHG